MTEKTDYYNDEESVAVSRYNEMVENNQHYYFDIYEFEHIIDNYIDQNEYKKAKVAINYALNIHPNAFTILQKKAEILMNEGFHFKAIDILQNLFKIESLNTVTSLLLGIAYCSVGEISKALLQFDYAISIENGDKEEMFLSAGTTLEHIGQYEFALKYFKLAHQENKENSVALYELAYCCEKLNFNTKSIRYYKEYLLLDPYSRLAWTNLAGIYYKLEKYEESIDAIEFAMAIEPNFPAYYFHKGLCEIFNHTYEKGIESLKFFLADTPDDAEAHYYIGEAYAKSGNKKEALKYFEKVLQIDCNYSDAYYGQAYILFLNKKYTDAYYSIKKAIKINPNESYFWHLSALINQSLEFIEDSEEAFKKSIELEHSDPQVWIDYSELTTGKKGLVKKINILSEAYEHFSENAEINYRLAAHLALIHNLDNAVFHLKEALKAEPSKLDIFRSIYSDKNSILESLIDQYFNRFNKGSID
jgi:tetratricopeptide (TPR) repeat protein